jgi:hypothetical protein
VSEFDVEPPSYAQLRSLQARIQEAAAVQAQAGRMLDDDDQFAEEAQRLARLDAELRTGRPVDTLPVGDVGFLLGPDTKNRLMRVHGSSRRTRWRKAVEGMPRPPRDASKHVTKAYDRFLQKVHEGKGTTVRGVPRQAGVWYQELARREVRTKVRNHVRACAAECGADAWAFVLDLPTFLPPGEAFDPAGNFKPKKDRPEVDDEDDGP